MPNSMRAVAAGTGFFPRTGHKEAMTKIATPKQVLSFWKKAGPKRWFKSDSEFDHEISDKFLVTHQAAELGKLASWDEEGAEGALALVIVLDQFPRNMFRGTARAFATDALALAVAKRAIERGFDRKIKLPEKTFLYLPFEHSENRADQETSLKLFEATKDKELVRWAKLHHDTIQRFGRFPHRNEILGRVSTPEEIAFLDEGGFRA
jgi:uncharacterized protein (DUF924 family)